MHADASMDSELFFLNVPRTHPVRLKIHIVQECEEGLIGAELA